MGRVTWSIEHGDCRDLADAMEPACFDAILTDPPYAIGMAKWDKGDTVHDPETWRKLARLLKPDGYLVAFAASRTYHRLGAALEEAGLVIEPPVAWIYGSGRPHGAGKLKSMMEIAAVARTGKTALRVEDGRVGERHPPNIAHDGQLAPEPYYFHAKAGVRDKLVGQAAGKAHPTPKPVALMRWLIRLTTDPGARILDPFCGGASTGAAAIAEGRDFVGFELDGDYVAAGLERLADLEAASS